MLVMRLENRWRRKCGRRRSKQRRSRGREGSWMAEWDEVKGRTEKVSMASASAAVAVEDEGSSDEGGPASRQANREEREAEQRRSQVEDDGWRLFEIKVGGGREAGPASGSMAPPNGRSTGVE
nr:hypothetical protein CFP56_62135 [Quercus suber]